MPAVKKTEVPKLLSVQAAAKKLAVSTRTVQKACLRWKMGTRIAIGQGERVVVMLTADDLKFLDRNLQRRVGRPTVNSPFTKHRKHERTGKRS